MGHDGSVIGTEKLEGLIPPLVLPLRDKRTIAYDDFNDQIDYVLAGGADGLWINGTSGDFFFLSDDERAQVVQAAVKRVAGRVPIIAQVGDASTRRTISHALRALDSGANFLAVVLPYYLPYTQTELKQYYREIATEISTPLFIYQIPQMSKVTLAIPSIIELARDGIVIGIKDSSGDLEFYQKLIHQTSAANLNLRCFNGIGSVMDLSLLAGGHGLMCAIANILPHLCKRVCLEAAAENWNGAKATQKTVLSFINVLTLPDRSTWAPIVAVYKWIMRELGIIKHDYVSSPLQPLSACEEELLRKEALPMARNLCAELLGRKTKCGSVTE